MLDASCSTTPPTPGMAEVVLGMAHRGRLNVLANVVGKSYAPDLPRVRGRARPDVAAGLGRREVPPRRDRQAHSRPSATRSRSRSPSNPSHLEAVDPVVEGMAARQARTAADDTATRRVLPVLIHGDAAFAGQGVVAETLNLSEVPGYEVGGTVHVVVNNQLGFTTAPELGRSSVYADRRRQDGAGADLPRERRRPRGRGAGHARSRSRSGRRSSKDVVVDMVCYRRYGHNEADEPAFTQPRMYELIDARRSVRKLYTETLVNRGDLTLEEAEAALERLPRPARRRVRGDARAQRAAADAASRPPEPRRRDARPPVDDRRAPRDVLEPDRRRARHACPTASTSTRSSSSILRHRAHRVRRRPGRLGARRGARVRLAGARGHAGAPRRPGHAARHVQPAPRRARRPRRPSRSTCRSRTSPTTRRRSCSTTRCSPSTPRSASSTATRSPTRDALGRLGGAVRRLRQRRADHHRPVHRRRRGQVGPAQRPRAAAPPRLRGPGPRALQRPHRALPHAVRRGQPAGRLPDDRGAVLPRAAAPGARAATASRWSCFTPKRYLRMPADALDRRRAHRRRVPARARRPRRRSTATPVTPRAALHRQDRPRADRTSATSCGAPAAVVRVEQLYPWPESRAPRRRSTATRTPREVWWVQEEPANMGAWNFVHSRLHRMLRDRAELKHVARADERRARRAAARRCTTREQAAAPRRRLRQAVSPASPRLRHSRSFYASR